MKASRSLGHLALAALSMSSAASAWSWHLPGVDVVLRRANTETTTSTSPAQATATNADNTFNLNTGAQITATTGTNTIQETGKTTGTATTTGTGKNAGKTTSGSNSTEATHTTFNAQDPAGSISMITPTTTAGNLQLYRIGDYITWGWNYTDLQATPTAIDILASCSFASRTFTLTQNMTFETPAYYTWDTGAYQNEHIAAPLLTEEYTLIIYDADSSVSATAEAGYLDTFEGFKFGLYTGQPYTPLSDWTCATCSGALSDTEKRALGFALTMSVVTVLSFTWFVTGMRIAL